MSETTSARPSFGSYAPPVPTPSIRPARRPRPRIPTWVAPVGLGALVLGVAIAAISPWPVGVYYDDGIYLLLGKALATGNGYHYLNLPGHPAATHYPPGYPALLALVWLVFPSFPENVALLKLVNALLLSFSAAGFFLFARRELELDAIPASVAVLLGCLTVPVLALTGVLFSEPMFLASLVVALPACERAVRDDRRRAVVVAALLAAGVTLIRSIGLPLVGGLVGGLLLRRRWRSAALATAVAAALLLPWEIWTALHADALPSVVSAGYGPYNDAVRDAVAARGTGFLGTVALHNTRDLARPLGAVFAPGSRGGMRVLALVALLTLLVLGAARLARRTPATALFMLGYAVIVIAWPYTPDRFLWGVWPLVLLTIAAGAAPALRGLREPGLGASVVGAHVAVVVGAIVLTVGLVRYNARGYREQWWDAAQRASARQLLPLVEWTLRNTRPDDVIASDGDPLVHLYTGRLTVPSARWAVEAYPGQPETASRTADLRTLLATFKVRYLLLSGHQSVSAPAAAALSQGARPRLQLITLLSSGGAVFTTTPEATQE